MLLYILLKVKDLRFKVPVSSSFLLPVALNMDKSLSWSILSFTSLAEFQNDLPNYKVKFESKV